MKRLTITVLAVAAVGFSGVGLANGITPTSIAAPEPSALIYEEMIELAGIVDASATISNVFQNTGDVAWAVRERGAGLADEGCNAPSGVAIVAGNVEGLDDDAALDDGEFSADIDAASLPAGLYCFALNFPNGGGRDFVDFYIVDDYAKVGGTLQMGKAERGNSPTHAFDGVIGTTGSRVVGSILINYRMLGEYCSLTPQSTVNIGEPAPGIGVTAPVRANGLFDNSCGGTADVWILGKGNGVIDVYGELLYPRGAIAIWYTAEDGKYDIDLDGIPENGAPNNWFPLARGNVVVGTRH